MHPLRFLPLLLLATLAVHAGPTAQVLRDIAYGPAGETSLRLDVGLPPGDGPFPVAILIHGGGWSAGSRAGSDKPGNGADITPWFSLFSAAGCVWFSVDYRLAPTHPWPACADDVATAIRWVKAHAAEYRGDPRRIVLVGHSAGGQLALFAATSDDPTLRVHAAIGFAPVTDLVYDSQVRGGLSSSLQQLLQRTKELSAANLEVLSPLSPINRIRPGQPPILLIQGDADRTVPLAMNTAFRARALAAGNRCDLIVLPGAQHGLLPWAQLAPDYPASVLAWLRKNLGDADPTQPN